MSDALTYLLKTRPDAVSHYFAFLKNCGTHLDPKTRALISVITKVDAQTERGFRQYLKRALKDGCSPLEVLDALLMAFPTLGLAKIVWAVDIILAMELPGFDAETLARAANGEPAAPAPAWHDLMAADALAIGASTRVEAAGRAVFVHRAAADDWRVWDARCPHQATEIPLVALDGCTLACPKHDWRFDVQTGACTANGDRPLRRIPFEIEGGRLRAQW